jgi:hypothetical protein
VRFIGTEGATKLGALPGGKQNFDFFKKNQFTPDSVHPDADNLNESFFAPERLEHTEFRNSRPINEFGPYIHKLRQQASGLRMQLG